MLASAKWKTVSWRSGDERSVEGPICCCPCAQPPTDLLSEYGIRVSSIWPGDEAWLIGEHRASGEKKYYLANLPAEMDLRGLAATIKARWVCEQAHQLAEGGTRASTTSREDLGTAFTVTR